MNFSIKKMLCALLCGALFLTAVPAQAFSFNFDYVKSWFTPKVAIATVAVVAAGLLIWKCGGIQKAEERTKKDVEKTLQIEEIITVSHLKEIKNLKLGQKFKTTLSYSLPVSHYHNDPNAGNIVAGRIYKVVRELKEHAALDQGKNSSMGVEYIEGTYPPVLQVTFCGDELLSMITEIKKDAKDKPFVPALDYDIDVVEIAKLDDISKLPVHQKFKAKNGVTITSQEDISIDHYHIYQITSRQLSGSSIYVRFKKAVEEYGSTPDRGSFWIELH